MSDAQGLDRATSLRRLRGFFRRCLRRGQWQLALSCVPLLYQAPEASKTEEILRALVTVPHLLRCDENHTPEQLSWFWLSALSEWFQWSKAVLPVSLKNETEFLFLLGELECNISEQVHKELHDAFLHSQHESKENRNEGPSPQLSHETITVLQDVLFKNPRLTQAIFQFLLVDDCHTSALEYNNSLHRISVDYLLRLLTSLEHLQHSDQSKAHLEEQRAEQIYNILSTMHFNVEHQASDLKHLCEELYRACRRKRNVLIEEDVQGCMLRKHNYGLIRLYGSVASEQIKEQILMWNAIEKVGDLSNSERAILALFSNPEQSDPWKAAYFYCCSTGKHFLEQIVLTALALIKKEDFYNLELLLKKEFKPLRRLLVLLGWGHCRSIESVNSLLCALHQGKDTCNDLVLKEVCDGLMFQVDALRWCIEHNSQSIPKKTLLRHLNSIESQSALYILHHLTNLAEVNEDDVLKLLQAERSIGKGGDDASISPQQHNSAVFQAFCAMKYAIYAISLNAHKSVRSKGCQQSFLSGSTTSTEVLNIPEESDPSQDGSKMYEQSKDCQESFLSGSTKSTEVLSMPEESITSQDDSVLFEHYLTKCQYYLQLLPAHLKLELLENIFSLFFVSLNDLNTSSSQFDDCAMEQNEDCVHLNIERPINLDSREYSQVVVSAKQTHHSEGSINSIDLSDVSETSSFSDVENTEKISHGFLRNNYLDLEHFTRDLSGFVVDELSMDAFLKMLKENIEELKDFISLCGENLNEEQTLYECWSNSTFKKDFSCRILQLSKYISEAQWRYKVVRSNRSACSKSAGFTARDGTDNRTQAQEQNLIPMMLSSPECLLVSCILRGNYIEAHQVALMYNLQHSSSYSELKFMECYEEVMRELARLEQKIENQISEANVGKPSNSRSTLKAIGNAAAAGMVSYSISDVMDKLLTPGEGRISALHDDFWIKSARLEKVSSWRCVIEELIPSAMTTFDLACTQARVWKTCKQLLETAERRLHNHYEIKGNKPFPVMNYPEGIHGFPSVLQQISKIITYPCPAPVQDELGDKISNQFKCNITEVLHTCYAVMSDEYIIRNITLDHEREQILLRLKAAISVHEAKGNLIQALLDQSSTKPHEVQSHPVRQEMSLLLNNLDECERSLENQIHKSQYIRSFFRHMDTLAKVIIQSINTELDTSLDLKTGNPFVVLQQKPAQLISYLLFEKQVHAERLSSLLEKENIELNLGRVILDCCCEPLSFCRTMKTVQTQSLLIGIGQLTQQCLNTCLPDICIPLLKCDEDREASSSFKQTVSDSNQYRITASILNFLKSKSNITAIIACLSASKIHKAPKSGLSWMELIGNKKESPLEMECIANECELLLSEFPVLQRFLSTLSAPFVDDYTEGNEYNRSICGKICSSLILLGFHYPAANEVIMEALQKAVTEKNWKKVLQILDLHIGELEDFAGVKDALLCCAAAEETDGWKYLFVVEDPDLRSKLALHFLDKWPLEACQEILGYCFCEPHIAADLKQDLQNKIKELEIYRKILTLKDDVWANWQDLKKNCVDNPHTIIAIILEAKDYELCEDWSLFYPIPTELLTSLHREHLLHLLHIKDTERSLQLLQRIKDQNLQLAVTEQALLQNPGTFACHFLSDYLLSHFQNSLAETRQHDIQNMHMGSKVLLLLPESAHPSYEHLLSSPLLLIEQLLMNMKIDWVSVAVNALQQLLVEPSSSLSTEDVDKLLTIYAGKALAIPFSFRERKPDTVSRNPDSYSQLSEPEPITPSSPADQPGSSLADWSRFQTPPGPPEKFLRRNKSSPEFVPPDTPPAKAQWIPDETETICMVCKNERFTMFNRRHHCRRCGRLVCSSCSMKTMVVEGCRENPARVCDQCHDYFSSSIIPEEDPEQNQEGLVVNLAEVLKLSKSAEIQWLLTLDEHENEMERSEFYYEQAPSASLCTAILNLHSKCEECGYQLIEHCCTLSKGLTNPEMDCRLLLDIMRNLLFSAKMIFVKAARSQDLELCDSYSSKVDLLKILVAASYKDIPSLDEIVRPAAVIRLRNRLLEAEYYSLAIEVSTKTGLDPAGVWHAWGMACLKSDNLPGAREKFSRCFKAPLDLNQKNVGSKLLEDVVQYLETAAKPILLVKDDDYFATLKELENTLKTRCIWYEMMPEGKIKNNTYYQECLHYLHTYGTHLEIIKFYMRRELMREALLYLLNKDCPGDIFIEGVFVPSYESGKLQALENLLKSIDSTLQSWSNYLIEVCKYLQQKNFYNILYELQQFMKDHVRAAMTCIYFFSYKAKNYQDLGHNQKWLIKSKEHLKTYLQDLSRSSRKKSFDTFRKKMAPSEVSRHINTIELQMEITRFLKKYHFSETTNVSSKPPPTLFGNSSMMIDVACKVILGGKNVEEGFGIAFRVIQDFQLDATKVYSKVCKELGQRKHYSEILQLVKCVSESGVASESDCDQIILKCVEDIVDGNLDELENLIREVKNDDNKIKAYLKCHSLRSAFLTAIKLEPTKAFPIIQEVCDMSYKLGQMRVHEISFKWLEDYELMTKEVNKRSTKK
ncbi:zinc finger FYVE domain-containing 26 isoform X2 [Pelobates cultripes]|uniref:Zinc finger FYVE domain-containing protein 26 n=1 Tax=Pelobates cultripes TaxID=61616 RepID=A0AAD1TLQ2_PELCU|nr:zinc finger FYVE domain-containing 26 isoform X2 [Pelobates cultripes]